MRGDPFARMNDRLLDHFGREAVLHGAPCKASIDRGVEIFEDGNTTSVRRDVATIRGQGLAPRSGQVLQITGGESYKLDKLIEDDGYTSSWSVI